MFDDSFIQHTGVKGMRWGVRKDRFGRTSLRKGAGRSEKLSSVTNQELSSRIKRLELEKQYLSLVNESNQRNKSSIRKGAESVGKILKDAGEQHIKSIASEQLKVVLSKGTVALASVAVKKAAGG